MYSQFEIVGFTQRTGKVEKTGICYFIKMYVADDLSEVVQKLIESKVYPSFSSLLNSAAEFVVAFLSTATSTFEDGVPIRYVKPMTQNGAAERIGGGEMEKQQTTIRLPEELKRKLDREAEKRSLSFNGLVNFLLFEGIKKINQGLF